MHSDSKFFSPMTHSVQAGLELHEITANGTKRTRIKRIFNSLSGFSSEISGSSCSNRSMHVETPLTSPQEEYVPESWSTLTKIKSFIKRQWCKHEDLDSRVNSLGKHQTHKNTIRKAFAHYRTLRKNRLQMKNLFGENIIGEETLPSNGNINNIPSAKNMSFGRNLKGQEGDARIIYTLGMKNFNDQPPDLSIPNCAINNDDNSSIPNLMYESESVSTLSDKGTESLNVLRVLAGGNAKARLQNMATREDIITSGSNNSWGKEPQYVSEDFRQMRIPTFRNESGLEIRSIASTIQGGTITEYDLLKLVREKNKSFMNAKFYDEGSDVEKSEVEDNHCMPSTKQSTHSFVGGNKVESVKFDSFSHLVIYDASKKCLYSPSTDQLTLKIPNKEISLQKEDPTEQSKQNKDHRTKSILKQSINEQEFIEAERARRCDEVGTDEFLEFVVNHENEKRRGEFILANAREKQLQNYYDDDFFPRIQMKPDKTSLPDFETELYPSLDSQSVQNPPEYPFNFQV